VGDNGHGQLSPKEIAARPPACRISKHTEIYQGVYHRVHGAPTQRKQEATTYRLVHLGAWDSSSSERKTIR
jgi:hypothetical protein